MNRRSRHHSMAATLALAIVSSASAQSTARLEPYERDMQFQLGVAENSRIVGSGKNDQKGTLLGADVALLYATSEWMRLRLDGWYIERRPPTPIYYNTQYLDKTIAVAVIGSAEFPIRLPWDVSIAPLIGGGFVPSARGRYVASDGATLWKTATGFASSFGLVLRWRHLVVEQHVMQIDQADVALYNGDNKPFAVGLRF
jgi:hypothetical protein